MTSQKYCVEYDKRGAAGCQKCKQKLEKGKVRLGKIMPNPFSDNDSEMKKWFHVVCLFESLQKARATTKKIESCDDLEGWEELKQEDKDMLLDEIQKFAENSSSGKKQTPSSAQAKRQTKLKKQDVVKNADVGAKASSVPVVAPKIDVSHRDNWFREFRRLCSDVAEDSGSIAKTKMISQFFTKGTDGNGFKGDMLLWLRLLLPGVIKRVYNMQSKVILKCFSQIFGTDYNAMLTHLESGDVAETVKTFFEQSIVQVPAKKSLLTLQDVDKMLEELSQLTKEDDQTNCLKAVTARCTSNDLRMVVRLIKRDLRINAGAKPVLDAVHPEAYEAFQTSRDLSDVVARVAEQRGSAEAGKPSPTKSLNIGATLMVPVLPMLAEACKSVEQALKKFPGGMYSEIKYDGERVQVHKQGQEFKYFSRSLKPVMPHKVQHLKDFIPQAFPHGTDIILDSEILLVETATGKPLPFGTLGVHKKAAFQDATVCLFVFDCIHYNGENLMKKTLRERKNILERNMVEIPNRVMFSEMKYITKAEDLQDMIITVLDQGLEGLVLKDVKGIYEPGKRHWLKVKKDYLAQGAMADSADLVVLGAFYGTGSKGGMMSVFLMGCLDTSANAWCTVTKVAGHDDPTLERLQEELDMVKISKNAAKVPTWLNVNKNLIPDLVCRDPRNSQVWEIAGAEFSKAEAHTADGISIRFPRVSRIRQDKTWKEATTLEELKVLATKSSQSTDWSKILGTPGKQVKRDVTKASDPSPVQSPAKRSKLSPSLATTSGTLLDDDGDDITQYLPTVFQGVQLYIPEHHKNYKEYRRAVIAFNGAVLEEAEMEFATHALIPDSPRRKGKTDKVFSGKIITEATLRNCIYSRPQVPLP